MIKKLGYAAIIAFAVTYCLSFFAPFVSPSSSWIIALLGLAFPYLFTLGLFLAVVLFANSNKLKWLLIFILAPGFLKISLFYRFNEVDKPSLKDADISVLSYNVRSFNRYKWIDSEDIHSDIAKIVKEANPDVLFLQEYYAANKEEHQKIIKAFAEECQLKYHFGYAQKPDGKYSGLFIFSKYPLSKTQASAFSKHMVNGIIEANIRLGDKDLRLINFHLASYQLNTQEEEKLEKDERLKSAIYKLRNGLTNRSTQVELLRQKILESSLSRAVIAAGDLNDTPHSYAYRNLSDFLIDSYRESGSGEGKTYVGKLPGFRIDYIFHSDQLYSLSYKTIRQVKSDHYPVLAQLSVAKDAPQ